MRIHHFDLEVGDIIEIKYRLVRDDGGADRWLSAQIVNCDPNSWPLARLSDGQITEVRRFMTWRWISPARQSRTDRMTA